MNAISEKMEITHQIINAKPRKLTAKWTAESMDDVRPWPTYDLDPIPVPGFYSSITEQIIREIIYRYRMRKREKLFKGVEEELTVAMAAEITKEIDQDIISDILKIAKEIENGKK